MVRSDHRGDRRTPRLALALALTGLLVAACGSDRETTSAGQEPPTAEQSTESSPFTAGPAPEGYTLAAAGRGTSVAVWGSDSFGTDEPYTVLSPDGTMGGDGVVVVALTGFAGYQGGLGQAVTFYPPPSSAAPFESVESFTHDGGEARYVPPGTEGDAPHWADLVVARGDDLAVRVTSPQGTSEELLDILGRVDVPDDHDRAPTVDAPGLKVVGSVGVDGLVALQAGVQPNTGEVPGPAAAHSVGWTGPGQTQLVVSTLPGGTLDLAALAEVGRASPHRATDVRAVDLDGRPATVITATEDETDYRQRTVVVEAAWGDLVVARATGAPPATEDDLLARAASVEPTDQATWDGLVIEATGGPGLHPDEGEAEIARGTAGGIDWLLQTGGEAATPTEPTGPQVDTCLKLSKRKRSCAQGGGGSSQEALWYTDGDEHLPDFALVVTSVEAASVRVTTATDEATADLVAVPGGALRAALVFVDDPGFGLCGDPGVPAPDSMSPIRVDAFDADGEIIGCLGSGPDALGSP